MNREVQMFKEGIFSLNTRRFGRIAELMIKELYGLKDPNNNAYDLLTEDNKRVEVKFSTVLKRCDSTIDNNIINQIINSKLENRMMSFEMAKKNNFVCNIQQVKPSEFEILYYGCFFEDKILICKIESNELIGNTDINYSEHQHRGNTGEGQFHITDRNIDVHLKKYFVRWLSYEELYNLFSK